MFAITNEWEMNNKTENYKTQMTRTIHWSWYCCPGPPEHCWGRLGSVSVSLCDCECKQGQLKAKYKNHQHHRQTLGQSFSIARRVYLSQVSSQHGVSQLPQNPSCFFPWCCVSGGNGVRGYLSLSNCVRDAVGWGHTRCFWQLMWYYWPPGS